MRRVLLGLGACVLALTLVGSASAGWHHGGYIHHHAVIVQSCSPYVSAPYVQTPYVPAPVIINSVPAPCSPVIVSQPIYPVCGPTYHIVGHHGGYWRR